MKVNPILEYLKQLAGMSWEPNQKKFYSERASMAREVSCVQLEEAFSPEVMERLRSSYRAEKKMCYKNASDLVMMLGDTENVRYVEGYASSFGIPIEHAFVRVGDRYVDPTFELALGQDVRGVAYVSCYEFEPVKMAKYLLKTRQYGNLSQYDFLTRTRPALAAKW